MTLRVRGGCPVVYILVCVGHIMGLKLEFHLLALCCEVIELSIIVEFILGVNVSQLLKVDLVA